MFCIFLFFFPFFFFFLTKAVSGVCCHTSPWLIKIHHQLVNEFAITFSLKKLLLFQTLGSVCIQYVQFQVVIEILQFIQIRVEHIGVWIQNSSLGWIWWRGKHARLNKGWSCSSACISKSNFDRHHQTKLRLKIYLCLSNFCQQNFQNIVTWGVELRSRNTIFAYIPMESLFSGVRPFRSCGCCTCMLLHPEGLGLRVLKDLPYDLHWCQWQLESKQTVQSTGLPTLPDSAKDFLILRENKLILVHKFDNLPDSGNFLSIKLYVI